MYSPHPLSLRSAGVAIIALAFLLFPLVGKGQESGPSVSLSISADQSFPATAVVRLPQEKTGDGGSAPVSYPADAAKKRDEGTVKLKMLIGADGSVKESEVVENGGSPGLLRAAVEGLRRAGFTPGTLNGTPAEMRVAVSVGFSMGKREEYLGSNIEMPKTLAIALPPNEDRDLDAFIQYDQAPGYDRGELSRLIVYPKLARENGIEGSVTLSVRIDTAGKPIKAIIRQSSNRIFEESAKKAAQELTYTPAIQNGRPVVAWLTFKIDFRFNDPPADSTELQESGEEEEHEYGPDDFVADAEPPQYSRLELENILQYPELARSNGIEGRVTLSVQVDTDGTVLDVQVRESTNTMFEEPAVNAARELHYTPGSKHGVPIKMWVTIIVDFELYD